ncbi:MAG: NAD(P)-dependent oxidoreductase [Armatimonadota bacterium]|nr:NAD(P)-dependent oxidoreductase [Armatimonadota bacterium]
MAETQTVGLVGVGTMGSRILARLAEAGYRVVARDIAPEAERRAAAAGAQVVGSPAEIGHRARIVLLSLPFPSDVADVVSGAHGLLTALPAGAVIADLSTVDPGTSRTQAALAEARGVEYLDAPVLGRPPGCGRWTLPVGGSAQALEAARPVLSVLATRVVHVGPPGSGNIVKLLNNLMFGAINAVTAEVLAICAAAGLDPQVFVTTVAESGAATVSNLFRELAPKIVGRDFSPAFTLDLLDKDVRLGMDLAADARVPTVIAPAVALVVALARAQGLGAEDTGAVVKVFERLTGVVVSAGAGARSR